MRAYSCLVILAVVSSPAHIFANEIASELDNAPAAVPAAATPKPLCRETVCPRLYMPVCGLVDGVQVTAPSRCVLDNKIRCSSALQRSLGKKVAGARFLHSGPCSLKAAKSSGMRMTRDMPIESHEEIVEEVPSEEEEGDDEEEDEANEEEDDANEEEDGSNEEEDDANEEAVDANEEADGHNEEEDDANVEESGDHVEIYDSGESGESGELNANQHHNLHELQDVENQVDLDGSGARADDDAEADEDHAEEYEDNEILTY